MTLLKKRFADPERALSTAALALVVLLGSVLGYAYGGYFVREWAPAVFFLALILLAVAVAGFLGGARSGWSVAATGLFIAYTAWSFASLLWSPDRGNAWFGSDLTLLYLLAFWLSATFMALGASRRWVLTASCLGPALVAAVTVFLLAQTRQMFEIGRLLGTVGYFNGEAAFLLVPFWVSMYVAGSNRVHAALRAAALAGAVLSVEVAVLTQSRGALVALTVSLVVFFLLSGQRLRGLLALLPVLFALFVSFPGLNGVYQAFTGGGDASAAIRAARSGCPRAGAASTA